jgi:hypothetical protein
VSRSKSSLPKLSLQVQAMLAGRIPIPPPMESQEKDVDAIFGKRIKGLDPRLAELLIDIHLHRGRVLGDEHADAEAKWLAQREELFALTSKVAAQVGDAAFFQQVIEILRVLEEIRSEDYFSFVRSYVRKIGKVSPNLPLSFIAQRVNEWLVNDGKRPVELAVIRDEMKALGLPYAQPQRGPKKKAPAKKPRKPRK